MMSFGQNPGARPSSSANKSATSAAKAQAIKRLRDHPSRRQERTETRGQHALAMAIMNREQQPARTAPFSGSSAQTQTSTSAEHNNTRTDSDQAGRTARERKSWVPEFSVTIVALLMAVPLGIAFMLASISINHRNGKGNMFSSSAFIVEISCGLEVALTMVVISCLSRDRWTRLHRQEWSLGWLGIVATSSLVSGIWIVMRAQSLEATGACVSRPKKHAWESDPDPGINECVAGLGVTRGMAGMRILVMAQYVICLVWLILWRRKLYLESWADEERNDTLAA